MLVNGQPAQLISIRDRGLLYGDGVFRTLRLVSGKVPFWSLHYQKLQQDCAALGIVCPDEAVLLAELAKLLQEYQQGILKLIVTRGIGQRGYVPPIQTQANYLWDYAPMPNFPVEWYREGIQLQLCELRLAHQPRLAGVKHLNRLENVLAAAELIMAEGLLLDEQDWVIEGTRTNLFMLLQNTLVTPDLSRCGVAGVARRWILAWAEQKGLKTEIRPIMLDELLHADEVFMTNSVIGVWPVRLFKNKVWQQFLFSQQLQKDFEQACL